MVKLCFRNNNAFTLTEILIATIMVGMVFLGGISIYGSAFKFVKTSQQTDVSTNPAIALEIMTKRISLSNAGTLTFGTKQLNVRSDYACPDSFVSKNTPADFSDDNYWHYGFVNGAGGTALRTRCDASATTNVDSSDSALLNGVDFDGSNFGLVSPSGSGIPNVVNVHLEATSPAVTLDTNVALGAQAKN